MPTPSAAQPFDYDTIADHYDQHRRGRGPFLPALIRLAADSKARHVLELGCGTGNTAHAFLKAYPCALTAIDRSPGMLGRAHGKGIPARFINADAARLPLADASVEFIFGVLMLHLNAHLAPILTECHRALSAGRAAFVTAPHDFIGRHILNRYFPSFAKIDHQRFQHEDIIQAALVQAGFTGIQCEITKRDPEPVDAAYVDRVASQFITTLRLIPQDEFAEGLQRLRTDVERQGQLDQAMIWEAAVISGSKVG